MADGGRFRTRTVDSWLKLVDYGEHPHRLGLQVVTKESAEKMARTFHSLMRRLARKFRGVPVYIGHPDDMNFRGQAGHGDTKAYGWVQSLEARDDGLWVCIRWSRKGLEILENAHFKFLSPRWEMQSLGDGHFAPKALLSVGLTNYPNIAVETIVPPEIGDLSPLANGEYCTAAGCAGPGEGERRDAAAAEENHSKPEIRLRFPILANVYSIPGIFDRRIVFSGNLVGRRIGQVLRRKKQEQRLLTLVGERMVSANETFSAAWQSIKGIYPTLFEPMTFSHPEG
ncbi:MAG: phage protease [Puniceicoccales bacterium]|nr:phage protease [Puniceicoccales bacterium]